MPDQVCLQFIMGMQVPKRAFLSWNPYLQLKQKLGLSLKQLAQGDVQMLAKSEGLTMIAQIPSMRV